MHIEMCTNLIQIDILTLIYLPIDKHLTSCISSYPFSVYRDTHRSQRTSVTSELLLAAHYEPLLQDFILNHLTEFSGVPARLPHNNAPYGLVSS